MERRRPGGCILSASPGSTGGRLSIRILPLTALLALALVGAAGCAKKSSPTAVVAPIVSGAPVADSPAHAIQRLQWAYTHRSPDVYGTLFGDDYVYTFASLDPAGDAFRDGQWKRAQELLSAQHMFVTGTATEEAATSISLDLDNALLPIADQRPGKDPKWHRQIPVSIVLDVQRPSSSLQCQGDQLFFLVRGDSAKVDGAYVAADSTRWYVEGWMDVSASTAPARRARPASPQPTHGSSWGQIKALYR